MKAVSKNDRLRQLGRTTTLAMVAGVPMIGTLATAEAAPPSHAPAWGYRAGQVQYGDRIRQDVSVTGVVTSDLPGDQFDVRADNGRIYRVVFPRRANEPRRISRGDRVVVEGNLDRDILVARDVRILDNRGTGVSNQSDRNFRTTGVVTSDLPGDQFDIRADDGRIYRVVLHRSDNEPRRLSRGDRVSVEGHLDRGILIAHDVQILDNRGNNGNNNLISREGVVIEDLTGDQFRMRLANGRTILVRGRNDEPRRLSRGDRVLVTGRFSDNREDTFIARSVRILDNRGSGWGQNNRITREGVVIEDLSGDQFRMRLESGRSILVRGRNDEPRRLSRGDRVLVTGRFSDNREDTFIAQSVRILDNRGNNIVTHQGVVIEDLSGDQFRMRLESGRSILVRGRNDEPRRLSRGDRVLITGRFSDNREDTFIAQSVRIVRNR